MPREVICVSIGQAGVQMSSGAWELFCMEHGIRPDGIVNDPSFESLDNPELDPMNTFFYSTGQGTQVPRAVLVDLEPTVIDEIRSGAYRNLFNPDSMINHIEDAASNYARGRFTIGKSLLSATLESIRRQTQRCDGLQGFFLISGSGGGTGAGFSNLLLERLSVEYGKSTKVLTTILPGPTLSNAIVEPYNVGLHTHGTMEYSDLSIILDNEAVYKICNENLQQCRPSFNNVNRLMAYVISNVTCSLRFSCSLNADMNQLQTNLVPYPRIHFPIVSYSPIMSPSHGTHEACTPRQIIKDVFTPSTRLVTCDATAGKFMACCTIFRGNVSPKWLTDGVSEIKKNNTIQFVDWCPTGFKIGICHDPPCSVPGSMMAHSDVSCMMLANNTSIGDIFHLTLKKFRMLFAKRAFVHWYVGEGMEEGEMNEALEGVGSLLSDYVELAQCETVNRSDDSKSVKKKAASVKEKPPSEGATASKSSVNDITKDEPSKEFMDENEQINTPRMSVPFENESVHEKSITSAQKSIQDSVSKGSVEKAEPREDISATIPVISPAESADTDRKLIGVSANEDEMALSESENKIKTGDESEDA